MTWLVKAAKRDKLPSPAERKGAAIASRMMQVDDQKTLRARAAAKLYPKK